MLLALGRALLRDPEVLVIPFELTPAVSKSRSRIENLLRVWQLGGGGQNLARWLADEAVPNEGESQHRRSLIIVDNYLPHWEGDVVINLAETIESQRDNLHHETTHDLHR